MADDETPLRVPYLDLAAPHRELQAALHSALDRTLASGWLIGGPVLEEFERAFATRVGVRHCVGLANGLDALRLALLAADIAPGDEIIVPSNTYIATWLAVSQVGAVPVPVEPDPVSYNVDPRRLSEVISAKTRAIIPVHLYGRCADMDEIAAVAKANNLFVLEDAAQAFGATYKGREAGALGDAAAWSFYPSKNLGALGDAGAVTTNDDRLADRLRLLRNYGSRTKYVNETRGWNSRLDPLQASFLSVKLGQVDDWWRRRDTLADRYAGALAGLKGIVLPDRGSHGRHGWHIYAILCEARASLCRALDAAGIGWLIHYPTAPAQSAAYRGTAPIGLLADRLANQTLSLPLHPYLSDSDQDLVIEAVRSWVTRR